MFKRMFSGIFALSCIYSYASEQPTTPIFGTYRGEPLTATILPSLCPQLPSQDREAIRSWMAQPYQHETIKGLSQLQWHLDRNFDGESYDIKLKKQLETGAMPNLSTWNFVFKIGDTNYFMYIPGASNRMYNLIACYRALHPDKKLTFADPVNFTVFGDEVMTAIRSVADQATYQGISRAAVYLRAAEAIEKFKLNKVRIPETYLIGVDERASLKAEDDKAVIVQRGYERDIRPIIDFVADKQMRPLRIKEEEARNIDADAIRQLLIMIIYATLFDVSWNNVKIDTSTNPRHFVFSDFELQNGCNPRDFFHKNEECAISHIRSGIRGINTIFGYIPHLKETCQKFMNLKDSELKEIGMGRLPESL